MTINPKKNVLLAVIGLFFSGYLSSVLADGDAQLIKANLIAGEHQWANNCARCHNLRSSSEYSPNQWDLILKHMRLQAGLTGQEARNITAFLMSASSPVQLASNTNSTSQSNMHDPASSSSTSTKKTISSADIKNAIKSGKAIYTQNCMVCHGANGKGAIPGAPDFTNANGVLKNPDNVLMDRIIHGFKSPNSPMAMPPKGGNAKLTTSQIKRVLRYIRDEFGK